MPRKKKRPTEAKHPIQLTTDEALERLFSREVRARLKELVGRGDNHGKKPTHQ
jgi:hypothetical protein